jgi:ribosome-binding protein aMBF1 (putative translation factor)
LPAQHEQSKHFLETRRQDLYRERMNDAQADPEIREYVATEVRAELARQRLSVTEAARRLGWGQTVLYRRVTGEIAFEASELAQVARLLGVPIEKFFPGDLNAQVGGGVMIPRVSALPRYRHLAAAA